MMISRPRSWLPQTVALLGMLGCSSPMEKDPHLALPMRFVELAPSADYLPQIPWTWEAAPEEVAANPPRYLMSEQQLATDAMVTTLAAIASPYVYVIEGEVETKLPIEVEVRLAVDPSRLEVAHQHRILRTSSLGNGRFLLTFNTYPDEHVLQLAVKAKASAYLLRAELQLARDGQDLRALGGYRGYADNPALYSWRRYLSLEGELKKSLLFPGSALAAYSIQIPKQAVLETHFAVLAGNSFRTAVTFALDFMADGDSQPRRLWSTQVSTQKRTQIGRWQAISLSLKEIAGKRGLLVFRTEVAKGERPLLAWGTPTLFARKTKRPNLLVITIDSLNLDRMSGAPGARDTTPFLGKLARESTYFPSFVTNFSTTQPSLLAMLYSQEDVGRILAQRSRPSAEDRHLLGILQDHGYLTEIRGDFVGTAGLGSMVDAFRNGDRHPSDSTLFEQTLNLLRQRRGSQQALWLHLDGPHIQTQLDANHRQFFQEDSAYFTRFPDLRFVPIWKEKVKLLPSERDRVILDYDRRLRQTDELLRVFWERAQSEGLFEDTLIVITADHGEDLYRHNPFHRGHGVLYDSTVRVPLLWIEPRKSGGRPAKRVDLPVGAVDLAPSILDFLGIPAPTEFQGESFLSLLDGKVALDRFHLSQQPCLEAGGVYSLRSARYKLIYNPSGCTIAYPEGYAYAPSGELYDLQTDPGESENLIDRHPELAGFMKRHLADRLVRSRLAPGQGGTFNEKLNEVMRMAGYVQ